MSSSSATKGIGCAFLFLLPFAVVGIGATGFGWYSWYRHHAAMSWTETPCTILSAKLEEHQGDDSTTYELTAEYEYAMDGGMVRSSRVSIWGGSDNIGSFHQRAYASISPLVGKEDGFHCYVNPNDPRDAILIRDLRWEMLAFATVFASVFGLVGVGGLIAVVQMIPESRRRTELRNQHPTEPWRWRTEWKSDAVHAQSRGRRSLLLFLSIYLVGATLPVVVTMPEEISNGNSWAFLGMLFLIPVAAMCWALLNSLRRESRYGQPVMTIETTPIRLGSTLVGAIILNATSVPEGQVTLHLACKETMTRRGKSSFNTVWEQTELIDSGSTFGDSNIPVSFRMPEEQPESDPVDDKVKWILTVHVPFPGIDYKAEFLLPVFRSQSQST